MAPASESATMAHARALWPHSRDAHPQRGRNQTRAVTALNTTASIHFDQRAT